MTWDYVPDITTRDIRDVINKHVLQHPRPAGMDDDDQYAAHILAELFVKPVLAWHTEQAERAAKMAEERAKENAPKEVTAE
jgi:hypothetical protein